MPDILDANGLQIESLADTLAALQSAFITIYGADVNLDSNTPDGQLIAIAAQIGRDNRELAVAVYNSFDLSKCTGVILDIRAALIGIIRKGGTYTQMPFDVTVDRSVTLNGLDDDYNLPEAIAYTITYQGVDFYLIDTTALTTGTEELIFRAKDMGAVTVATGSTATQSTIVLGVTAVENSSAAIQVGEDQETDNELRLRCQKSSAINSAAYLNGLEAKLLNLTGVTEASVYENDTSIDDYYGDGVPKNCIWAVVKGGSNEDIADIIYRCKAPGCNILGDVEEIITTISGIERTIKFGRPVAEDLYIRFDLKPTALNVVFDQDSIKSYISENLTYKIGEFAETSKVTNMAILAINNGTGYGVPLNVEIGTLNSTGEVIYTDYIETTAKNYQFTVASENITITEV